VTFAPNPAWTAEIAKPSQEPIYFARFEGLDHLTLDPLLDVWDTSTDLVNWTEVGTVTRVATPYGSETYSALIERDGGGQSYVEQVVGADPTIAGFSEYSITVAVRGGTINKANDIVIQNATGSNFLQDDGTWSAATNHYQITAISTTEWTVRTIRFTTEAAVAALTIKVRTDGHAVGENTIVGLLSLNKYPGDFSTGPVKRQHLQKVRLMDIPSGGGVELDSIDGTMTIGEVAFELFDVDGLITRLVSTEKSGNAATDEGSLLSTLINRRVTIYGGYASLGEGEYPPIFTGLVSGPVKFNEFSYSFQISQVTRLLDSVIMVNADEDHTVTIEGNLVNVVASILRNVFSTDDPDFPLDEVSAATSSTEVPTGIGVDDSFLNFEQIKAERELWHPHTNVRIQWDAEVNAMDELQIEFMRAFHAFFPTTGDGRLGIRFVVPPAAPFAAQEINSAHIVEIRSWSRRLDQHLNKFRYFGDFDLATGVYLSNLYAADPVEDTDNRTITGEVIEFEVKSRWLKSNFLHSDHSGERIAAEQVGRLRARYLRTPVELEIDVLFSRRNVEEGDVVIVSDPKLPDIFAGTLGLVGRPMYVISSLPRWAEGVITLRLLDTGYQRYGVIGPAGLANYNSATVAQKERYAWVGDTDNTVGSGNEPGYVVI